MGWLRTIKISQNPVFPAPIQIVEGVKARVTPVALGIPTNQPPEEPTGIQATLQPGQANPLPP